MDDTCCESEIPQLTLLNNEGNYNTPLYLSLNSYDMAVVYVLVSDFMFIHTSIISVCPVWSSIVLSDLAWSAIVIEFHRDLWRHFYLSDISYEMIIFPTEA